MNNQERLNQERREKPVKIDLNLPTDRETLQKIYQEGFEAGGRAAKPEENPYNDKKDEATQFPLQYGLEWAKGATDGQDLSEKFSNLSPDVRERKRGPSPEEILEERKRVFTKQGAQAYLDGFEKVSPKGITDDEKKWWLDGYTNARS